MVRVWGIRDLKRAMVWKGARGFRTGVGVMVESQWGLEVSEGMRL